MVLRGVISFHKAYLKIRTGIMIIYSFISRLDQLHLISQVRKVNEGQCCFIKFFEA